jgi:hypothetical protein
MVADELNEDKCGQEQLETWQKLKINFFVQGWQKQN